MVSRNQCSGREKYEIKYQTENPMKMIEIRFSKDYKCVRNVLFETFLPSNLINENEPYFELYFSNIIWHLMSPMSLI
jgi:hypothetical protein